MAGQADRGSRERNRPQEAGHGRVDVGPINRLLIREYVLKALYDFSSTSFEHRGQNDRNVESLGELGESNHVVHDQRRLVTVKVRELKRLMIDEENDALLRGQQSRKPRQLRFRRPPFRDACLCRYRRLPAARGTTLRNRQAGGRRHCDCAGGESQKLTTSIRHSCVPPQTKAPSRPCSHASCAMVRWTGAEME